MAISDCCGKRKSSRVADAERGGGRTGSASSGGRENNNGLAWGPLCQRHKDARAQGEASAGARRQFSGVRRRLWRSLEQGQLASFRLLLADPAAGAQLDAAGDSFTLLARACQLGRAEAVSALLERGADPNLPGPPVSGYRPLHWAVHSCQPDCARRLLADPRTDPDAADARGFAPLHLCCMDASWEIDDKEGRLECIRLLMADPRCSPNLPNKYGQTPLVLSLLRFYEERVRLLLEAGRRRLDVDWCRVLTGRAVRSVIRDKFPALVAALPPRRVEAAGPGAGPELRLLAAMQAGDEAAFAAALEASPGPDLSQPYPDPYHCTALELSVRAPVNPRFAEMLLAAGADPNTANCVDRSPVLHQAAECANYAALRALLDTGRADPAVTDSYEQTALHAATLSLCPSAEELAAISATIGMLLDYRQYPDRFGGGGRGIDVNAGDMGGDTALHNAAYFGNREVVMLLLERGAKLMIRNDEGDPPLAYMDEETLRCFLDEQCLSNGLSPQSSNFELVLRYDALVPSAGPEERACETNALGYITDSPDLRGALTHPVISAFLYAKWYNVVTLFLYNLLVYLCFVACVTAYTVVYNTRTEPEETNVTCAQTAAAPYDPQQNGTAERYNGTEANVAGPAANRTAVVCERAEADGERMCFAVLLRSVLALFLLFLCAREACQAAMQGRKYFRSAENVLELLLVAGTLALLCSPWMEPRARKHVSGLVILLAWTELVLISGRLPAFSVQLEMFKKVCLTFLRFMAWYSMIVLAFAFSFYVLFYGEEPFYRAPGMSVLKAVVMLAGEFEASELRFDSAPVTSHLLFVAFVFLVAIVLLNLLNGLAVSDTQAIRSDATVLSLVSMVRLVAQIEDFLLLADRAAGRLGLRRLRAAARLRLQLFDSRLPRKQMHVFPAGRRLKFQLDAAATRRFERFRLDRDIVDAAVDIVISRNQQSELERISAAVGDFSERLDAIQGALDSIQAAVAN